MPIRKQLDESILPGRRVIKTNQPAQMREFLAATYKAPTFRVRGGAEAFNAQANRGQLEGIGFDYCAYDADVSIEFPETEYLRQPVCLSGSGEAVIGSKESLLSIDETCIIPPGARSRVNFASGYRQLVLRIDPASLRVTLKSLMGDAATHTLEMQGAGDFRTPQLQILRRLVLFYARELDSFGSHLSAAVKKEFEQSLLLAFLTGHRHNYSFRLDRPTPSATPKQIWLVEAYIEANWNKPISIEEIAKMTGVSVRSIFQAFKDRRGYSPMAFAKGIRLQRAREMLQRGDVTLSVAEIALSCGFQSHGHFSRDYKLKFAELPSQTLAKSHVK